MPGIVKDSDSKMTQALSRYNYEAKHNCVDCEKFLAPSACDIVQGPIAKNGSCMFHSTREKR